MIKRFVNWFSYIDGIVFGPFDRINIASSFVINYLIVPTYYIWIFIITTIFTTLLIGNIFISFVVSGILLLLFRKRIKKFSQKIDTIPSQKELIRIYGEYSYAKALLFYFICYLILFCWVMFVMAFAILLGYVAGWRGNDAIF